MPSAGRQGTDEWKVCVVFERGDLCLMSDLMISEFEIRDLRFEIRDSRFADLILPFDNIVWLLK